MSKETSWVESIGTYEDNGQWFLIYKFKYDPDIMITWFPIKVPLKNKEEAEDMMKGFAENSKYKYIWSRIKDNEH